MKLGFTVTDCITGFTGVVTGHVEYITGCNQSLVQPKIKEGGEFQESRWMDDDRLLVVNVEQLQLPNKDSQTPGPDRSAPRK